MTHTDNDVTVPTTSDHTPIEATSPAASTPAGRRAVASGSIGSALEWFDFAVYGTLSATVFPVLFFSDVDPQTAILASFATFGAGFFARPIGGVVFGALGDRLGRKNILMLTLVLMGAASALIGFLPTYDQVGLLAPALLVFLRFAQGFALGGEVTGSQLLALEHAPTGKRGIYGALMAIGSPIAQVLASLTLTGLALGLSDEAFTAWGWRVPFLLGIALIVVGYYIRRKVEETPVFQENAKLRAEHQIPQDRALAVLKKRPGRVIKLVLVWAAPAALFWICVTYSVSYMTGTLGYDRSISFGLLLTANFVSIFAGLLGGWLSDRIGRRAVFVIGLVALGIAAPSIFPILQSLNYPASVAIIAFALSAVQFMAGAQAAFFAEALPTSMRFTGSALGYTGANLLFSAPTPFIAAWILQATDGNTMFLSIYGLALVAISAVALALLPNRHDKPLEH